MSVTLHVKPTEALWQQFFVAHYAADHQLRIRFWYGLISLALGAFGLGGLFASPWPAALLLTFGLYCVLSRSWLTWRSLRKVRGTPHFLHPVVYTIDETGLAAATEGGARQLLWQDFATYRLVNAGVLLYLPDGTFLGLPRQGCIDTDWRELERLLARSPLGR